MKQKRKQTLYTALVFKIPPFLADMNFGRNTFIRLCAGGADRAVATASSQPIRQEAGRAGTSDRQTDFNENIWLKKDWQALIGNLEPLQKYDIFMAKCFFLAIAGSVYWHRQLLNKHIVVIIA